MKATERKHSSFLLLLMVLSVTLLFPNIMVVHSFKSIYQRQNSKQKHYVRMGHTDSLPIPQTNTLSVEIATVALFATFAALRPVRVDAMDIDAAMGSFGGNSTSRSTTPATVGVEQQQQQQQQPTPPASLTQFMATEGIKQAGPLTHGF